MILENTAQTIEQREAIAWQSEINQAALYPMSLRAVAERLLAKMLAAKAQVRDLELCRWRQEQIIKNLRSELVAIQQQMERSQ